MKINELMFGDWVQDQTDRYKRICSTFDMDCAALYSPIPSTAEILEQNGFKALDNIFGISGQHYWVWWQDTQTSVSLWCRELKDDPKDGWMVEIKTPTSICLHKIKYIHELQQVLRVFKIDKEIIIKD